MHIFRHIHIRAALLALVGLLAVGGGAAYAATRTSAPKIGTGVVVVNTNLGYAGGSAAGTGMVLTSSGEILTNNHVIAGATAIRVTDETTGRAYTASVVGTDAADDVAVLQLKNASGLSTAKLAGTAAAIGDPVTAVGNAGGTGTLTAASGTVTGLDQHITTESEGAAAGETLSGLIETNADVVAGDSGGPLENSSGQVVGIDTAASSDSSEPDAYAIPISSALTIANRITDGERASGITLGYPAFLGVQVASSRTGTDGALLAGVIDGTPAASAGLAAGDTITAVDGSAVASGSALTDSLKSRSPGEKVTLTYTDEQGSSHTATVTLTTGPAD
jgi:S1-C subfamily serine protease